MHRLLTACALLLTGCTNNSVVDTSDTSNSESPAMKSSYSSPMPEHQQKSPWFQDAQGKASRYAGDKKAKNVILFLGDGMGISTITAARILAGQQNGQPGEENSLSFEDFPVTGLVKTYNVNSQTADSAGTMSAIMTGVKTDIGIFGVDENATRSDCASGSGHELLSLLEIAELAGKATGVVTTTRLTHATPAATYANTVNRDWEDDSEMPEVALAQGCRDIAAQFLSFTDDLNARYGAGASNGIEVALGGGRRHFLPKNVDRGRRADGRNLIAEWQTQHPQGTYVENKIQLAAAQQTPLLGLLSASHMQYASQRQVEGTAQPSLQAMTGKAIELLEGSDQGYLLVVEAGRIDHAHHAGNAFNALNDTIELSDTVAETLRRVDPEETLILVTADHSHVFTMAGYPRRGNPILGKVVSAWSDEPTLDGAGQPYTTLGYMNGRGFADYGPELNADHRYLDPHDTGRKDLTRIDTTAPGYHQEALVPMDAETHGGEDVAVYAVGPGAQAAGGVNEQNLLFHVMLQATDWEETAARRIDERASSH